MRGRIFVSLAAYRDAELPRTLRQLIAHAHRPERLSICVLDQNESPMPKPRSLRGARLIHDHLHPDESRGACWARAEVQRRMDGEEFFLQLDTHHVFQPGWDDLLDEQFASCPADKPVLTAYLPPYGLKHRPVVQAPSAAPMQVSHFDQDGVVIYRAHSYKHETQAPAYPARFLSAHFIFARREFVEQVRYDPELYFYGEESTLGARAYTHGFDLFHPGRTIAWHHYCREGARRHWNDHTGAIPQKPAWTALQRQGVFKYNRIFCLLPHVSAKDGLGTRRSLAAYEAWTGVDHYWRLTHPSTAALRPPPAALELNWTVNERLLRGAEIRVHLPPLATVDPRPCRQVHLAIQDASPRDGAARRCTPQEYAALQRDGWRVHIRYRSGPLRLIVWPLLETLQWGKMLSRHLDLPELFTARATPPASTKTGPPPAAAPRSRPPRMRSA